MKAKSKVTKRRRSKSLDEYVRGLDWNLKDAKEALHNAVEMGSFANARKYMTQIEKLQSKLFYAGSKGEKRTRRERQFHLSAGERYGRGKLP